MLVYISRRQAMQRRHTKGFRVRVPPCSCSSQRSRSRSRASKSGSRISTSKPSVASITPQSSRHATISSGQSDRRLNAQAAHLPLPTRAERRRSTTVSFHITPASEARIDTGAETREIEEDAGAMLITRAITARSLRTYLDHGELSMVRMTTTPPQLFKERPTHPSIFYWRAPNPRGWRWMSTRSLLAFCPELRLHGGEKQYTTKSAHSYFNLFL